MSKPTRAPADTDAGAETDTAAETVACRKCDATIDPRERDTIPLAEETLALCVECWSWTAFDPR